MKTKTNQSLIVCTVIIFIVTILGTISLSEQRKFASSLKNLLSLVQILTHKMNMELRHCTIYYKLGTPKFLNFWLSVKQVLISWIKKVLPLLIGLIRSIKQKWLIWFANTVEKQQNNQIMREKRTKAFIKIIYNKLKFSFIL